MYASVTTGKFQPGKRDEFLAVYQDSVLPIAKELPGVKHAYILTDADADQGMSIFIYESEADAQRTQASGDYQQAISKLAQTLDMGTLQRHGYEVNIELE